jgi:hypothetical protein
MSPYENNGKDNRGRRHEKDSSVRLTSSPHSGGGDCDDCCCLIEMDGFADKELMEMKNMCTLSVIF